MTNKLLRDASTLKLMRDSVTGKLMRGAPGPTCTVTFSDLKKKHQQ